jgi:hypothetical protein
MNDEIALITENAKRKLTAKALTVFCLNITGRQPVFLASEKDIIQAVLKVVNIWI